MRKTIHRLLPAIFILIILGGCATHEKFVMKYNALIGRNIEYLISRIGYPDNTYTLPNKHRVYVYERSRIYSSPTMPVMGYGYGGYYGGYAMFGYTNEVVQERCKLFLETDRKGTILHWSSRGNHCVAH